jgi:hypothetical protein
VIQKIQFQPTMFTLVFIRDQYDLQRVNLSEMVALQCDSSLQPRWTEAVVHPPPHTTLPCFAFFYFRPSFFWNFVCLTAGSGHLHLVRTHCHSLLCAILPQRDLLLSFPSCLAALLPNAGITTAHLLPLWIPWPGCVFSLILWKN